MNKDLATLKVNLTADNSNLKKEMNSARQTVRNATEAMRKETRKIQNPFKNTGGNDPLSSVKGMMQKWKSIKKDFQIKAGIKVPTEDYQMVNDSIQDIYEKMRMLKMEEKALAQNGDNKGHSKKYESLKESVRNAEKELEKLLQKERDLERNGEKFSFTTKYAEIRDSLSGEKEKLSELQKERENRRRRNISLNDVTADGKLFNYDDEIKKTENDVKRLEKTLENLEKNGKMLKPTEAAKKLSEQIEAASAKVGKYKTEMVKLSSEGKDIGTDEWVKNQQEIEKCTKKLSVFQKMKENLENDKSDTYRPVSIPRQLFSFGKSALGGLGSGIKTIVSKGWGGLTKLLGGMKSAFTSVGTVIKRNSGLFGALIQKFTSGIPILRRFTGAVKNNGNSFGSSLKNVLKYTLGIRSLFVLVNKLRSALVDGFKNLAQYSGQTNSSISLLMSSLTQLKNSFAAAFAPILNVVAPILDIIIQKVISVVNAIGQLTSALTGQGTVIRAKKIHQDYAASLNTNADSANNANEANKKLQKTILGFDQINKMDENSGNSDGLQSAGNIGGVDPSDMFETVTIDSKFKDIAQQIKEAWKNADFTEIGSIVGNKLNDALNRIPWESIQGTCSKIAKIVSTFLNGFIATTDWGLVGNTVAQGINTAFGFADTFAQSFDWSNLGSAIGNGINGALSGLDWNLIQGTVHNVVSGLIGTVNNFIATADWNLIGQTIGNYWNTKLEILKTAVTEFDWVGAGNALSETVNGIIQTVDFEGIGETFSNGLKGLLDFGITALKGIKWSELGEKVREGLAAIDWNGIADKTFEAIGSAFGGLASFLGGLIGDKVQEAKNYFTNKIEECGGSITSGILKGIGEGILGIGDWIKEHIFDPFISGFKSVFGIHSPSTVMAEMGEYLMEGLLGGIKGLVEDVSEVFTNIRDTISGVWDTITTTASDVWSGISKTVGDAWEGLKISASEKFGNIKDSISDAWDSVKETAGTVWENISNTVGSFWDWLTGKSGEDFPEIEKDVKDSFGEVSKASDKDWGESHKAVTDSLNVMKGESSKSMRQVFKNVQSYTNSIWNITANNWDAIGKKVSDTFSNMPAYAETSIGQIEDKFSSLGNRISNAIGDLSWIGQGAAQSIANAMKNTYFPSLHYRISSYTPHYSNGKIISNTPVYSPSWYASGGFPNTGEMFIARENGPELVGRMGRKNTVANNSQIIEGIKEGVFEAVMDAFNASDAFKENDSGKDAVLEFTLVVDSETAYKLIRKGQKKYEGRYSVVETV